MPDSTVTVVGSLTRDPELRYTGNGTACAKFGVAVSRRFKRGDQWEEQTSYFDIVCWREMAEHVAESVSTGTRVVVSGRLEQRSWEAKDGTKRSAIEISADEVAPSLRWATCEVTRTERTSSPGQQRPTAPKAKGDDFGEEPW